MIKKVGSAILGKMREWKFALPALLLGLCSSSVFAEGYTPHVYTFDEAGQEMTSLATGLKDFLTNTALPQIVIVVAAVLGIVMLFRAIRWCLGALNV